MIYEKKQKYLSLLTTFSGWRFNNIDLKENKIKVGILPYVVGLRFSAQIIYLVRKLIKNSELLVAWGHVVDENGVYVQYSNECDIIIYKKETENELDAWNGDETKDGIMNFRFIYKKSVVAVISCKSLIRRSGYSSIDKKYPKQLEKFTKEVLLFGECCDEKEKAAIIKQSKACGYKACYLLYSIKDKKPVEHESSWEDFEKRILNIAHKYSKAPNAPTKKKIAKKKKAKR